MLDVTTLRVMSGAIALTLLGLFYLIPYRHTRAAYAGWWCVTLALFLVSAAFYLADGTDWQWLGNPIGNVTTTAAGATVWSSTRSLSGSRPPAWQLLGGPALVAVVSAASHPGTDRWAGAGTMLGVTGVYLALSAREMWRERRTDEPRRSAVSLYATIATALGLNLGLLAGFYAARCVALYLAGPSSDLFDRWLGSGTTTAVHVILLVIVAFSVATLSTEQRLRQAQAIASRDSLTGVLNRGEFLERAAEVLDDARATADGCVAIMADLDHFKSINDRFGHAAGDRALSAFASACQAALRPTDVIGRLGGEEFGIVLARIDPSEAEDVAQRIAERFGTLRLAPDERLTASFGIAPLEAGLSLEELLERADAALYRAKRAGRDRVAHYRG